MRSHTVGRRSLWLAAFSMGALLGCAQTKLDAVQPGGEPGAAAPAFAYPPTRREDVVDTIHGQRVSDPYRWLEGDDEEVRAWMEAQDELTRGYLGALPGREALAERIAELTYIDWISPPHRRGNRFFYTRGHKDREKPVYYFKQGKDGEERVLIDPNLLSEDGSVSLRGLSPSHSGRYVAYKLSENNADDGTLYVRDLETGQDSEIDVIEGARFASPSWTPDDRGFYYVALPIGEGIPADELQGHAHVRYHVMGRDPATDEIVVPPSGDPTVFISAGLSEDGRWFLYYRTRGEGNEVYFRDLRRKSSELVPLATGFEASYSVDVHEDRFYVETDEGAPNGRVFLVDPKKPARATWKEITPERTDALQAAYVVGGHLVLSYLHEAHSEVEIHDLSGKLVRKVALPGLGSASGLLGRGDDDEAYYLYTSYTTPPQIYQTSVSTGATELWGTIDFPVDTSRFEAEQVWFDSKDGTRVSMFVVRSKGLALDGSHPTLLYGYGGFGSSMTPSFDPDVVAWVERGGVYAEPNLRGGGEYGKSWHEGGMLANKQNVFDDFIAAAEYLVAAGYTRPERLAISGGSNGGLLVGAAMTQRPDLFGAVICSVPLLDMIRYHEFGAGKFWIPEYGDPDEPEAFAWLYAYSPYHRVRPGARYPALLMQSADSDDRVHPMHARKFVAAVQAAAESDRPALLRVERNAGHGGAGLRNRHVEKTVDEFLFLWDQLEG